jgi:hypothetical protein
MFQRNILSPSSWQSVSVNSRLTAKIPYGATIQKIIFVHIIVKIKNLKQKINLVIYLFFSSGIFSTLYWSMVILLSENGNHITVNAM